MGAPCLQHHLNLETLTESMDEKAPYFLNGDEMGHQHHTNNKSNPILEFKREQTYGQCEYF